MNSIRRQLVLSIGAVMLLGGVFAGILTYSSARLEVRELFDYQLRTAALSFRSSGLERLPALGNQTIDPPGDLSLQIWSRGGALVFHSNPSAQYPLSKEEGLRTISSHDGDWRIYTHVTPERIIQAGQPIKVRRILAAGAALRILLPLLVILPIAACAAWILIGRGLQPLRQVSSAIEARKPESLDPLPRHRIPAEIRPLVDALNQLLARLRDALEGQRSFIADAAHELRTPLTALVLQAELAQSAHTDLDRRSALKRLRGGILRATHLIEQLLALARLEPEAKIRPWSEVELSAIAKQTVIDFSPLARLRGVDLGMATTQSAVVDGEVRALQTLVRNLVDNAVRYAPQGGRVDVCVMNDAEHAVLEVTDNGPGIPRAHRNRVFERFYRCGDQEDSGTGLGLAIVRRIVDQHRAQIELLDGAAGQGLRVRVRFRRAVTSPSYLRPNGEIDVINRGFVLETFDQVARLDRRDDCPVYSGCQRRFD